MRWKVNQSNQSPIAVMLSNAFEHNSEEATLYMHSCLVFLAQRLLNCCG